MAFCGLRHEPLPRRSRSAFVDVADGASGESVAGIRSDSVSEVSADERPQRAGVVISRSGRTSEAVRAARTMVQEMELPVIGITCAEKSELEAICHQTIALQSADVESTVRSRSFSSMLIALQYLAASSAGNATFIDSLRLMASQFSPKVEGIADQIELFVENQTVEDYVFLGQGAFHGVAREAALKLMEMSCSYSQFFHTLEFRHRPKAIVSPATCLTFFLSNAAYEADAEVLEEMKELGATTIAICNQANIPAIPPCAGPLSL
jgi:glucosamine--fructose-6-phosphate aminotransferase (isomerizing)